MADAEHGATYDLLDPISAQAVTRAASASIKDASRAANAAAAAFPAWSRTEPQFRADVLTRAASMVRDRADAFVSAMKSETGAPESWARFNCKLAAGMLEQAAQLTSYWTIKTARGRDDNVQSYHVRQPIGVVLGIAPWNAPVVLGARAVAAPLACGNTVILKASELCPKTHHMIVEILIEAGAPAGTVNLVSNSLDNAAEIVDALVGHAAVRKVNFTGSTRVGRMVAENCARHLKPCLLELSGKAPLIVLDDADLEEAVEAAVFGAFFNQGQICISTERIIVERSVRDRFMAMFTERAATLQAGDQQQGEYALGPLISASAAMRASGLIEDAVGKGARVVAGGSISGTVMQPTVIEHVDSSMRIYHEESFAPIAAIISCANEDEAVSIANDTAYGLASAVFSRDIKRAKAVAMQLETGICHINGPTVFDDPAMPFGGMKDSGYGRFGGEASIHEFTELRWLSVHEGHHQYPI